MHRTPIEATAEQPRERPNYADLVFTHLPQPDAEDLWQQLVAAICADDLAPVSTSGEPTADGEAAGTTIGKAECLALGREVGQGFGRRVGRMEGLTRAILIVLDARGIPASGEARERILARTSISMLESRLKKSAVVSNIDELLS
ncbi:hypothetical protein AB0C27_23665 [Nonomuraea sp. NPDC048882]|uniref:hypothetical protein n=1 Tax=unclassified Nonomuraea TaxID=2593643 RepID=UPI0033EA102F